MHVRRLRGLVQSFGWKPGLSAPGGASDGGPTHPHTALLAAAPQWAPPQIVDTAESIGSTGLEVWA